MKTTSTLIVLVVVAQHGGNGASAFTPSTLSSTPSSLSVNKRDLSGGRISHIGQRSQLDEFDERTRRHAQGRIRPCTQLQAWRGTSAIEHDIGQSRSIRRRFGHAIPSHGSRSRIPRSASALSGWVQQDDGEWEWEEDDPSFSNIPVTSTINTGTNIDTTSIATPKLPSGKLKPKQSLGQNYLRDPNTVAKMIRAFHKDATRNEKTYDTIVELGPGAGALTDRLYENYGPDKLQCIEIDQRAVELLGEKYPDLVVHHQDVLQVDYPQMAEDIGQPLIVIGNLPYYITSQILFALADASHFGAVDCATVTMQWEVGQRMVAPTCCKDYGILSVVFQTYAEVNCHFKIPPTVFYPQPKVDSAFLGLHFLGPSKLRQRLAGVDPMDLRRVVTTAFRQRRKTVRNTLKKLAGLEDVTLLDAEPLPLPDSVIAARDAGDEFALSQELPTNWAKKRPEELTPGQFVELTRLLLGARGTDDLGRKVWRKLKHGT